jgi:AcrR family transcriptional regulator
MDRRQRKTREAIFSALIELLSEKTFSQITVEEIIRRADVGRATFYAHFETKDFLLKALCEELFDHIFEAQPGEPKEHLHLFDCDAPDSVFLHLFQHLQKNDNNILALLSCHDNELFLRYFKTNLTRLVKSQRALFESRRSPELPESFWDAHISATFTETLRFWIDGGMKETPEQITRYFMLAV